MLAARPGWAFLSEQLELHCVAGPVKCTGYSVLLMAVMVQGIGKSCTWLGCKVHINTKFGASQHVSGRYIGRLQGIDHDSQAQPPGLAISWESGSICRFCLYNSLQICAGHTLHW